MSFFPEPAPIRWRKPLAYYAALLCLGAGLAAAKDSLNLPDSVRTVLVIGLLAAMVGPIIGILICAEREREALSRTLTELERHKLEQQNQDRWAGRGTRPAQRETGRTPVGQGE